MSEIVRIHDYPIEASDKTRARIPHIITGLVQGKTLGQIAENLGVDPRTLYRDRQTIQFHQFINDLLDIHLKEIAELSKDPKTRIEALKERGRTTRAGQEKRIYKKEEKAVIHVTLHGTPQPTNKN